MDVVGSSYCLLVIVGGGEAERDRREDSDSGEVDGIEGAAISTGSNGAEDGYGGALTPDG
ncbi:hypothetical protein PAXINDRAFT_172057 [Paxillus involutus ATCC 200175]|uniref:Uncharacterized protein n=1 Tax=Paxillus involutus ATCC 200175 TaxID=664439 RepID=A0A0C9TU72_PAXIN|nr:hypothetical protein PAXINDRAFT_172057 [Paxillus involutus ATCC 200175]